jgi:hypothetical protein
MEWTVSQLQMPCATPRMKPFLLKGVFGMQAADAALLDWSLGEGLHDELVQ